MEGRRHHGALKRPVLDVEPVRLAIEVVLHAVAIAPEYGFGRHEHGSYPVPQGGLLCRFELLKSRWIVGLPVPLGQFIPSVSSRYSVHVVCRHLQSLSFGLPQTGVAVNLFRKTAPPFLGHNSLRISFFRIFRFFRYTL
jgi:hypothetical protein